MCYIDYGDRKVMKGKKRLSHIIMYIALVGMTGYFLVSGFQQLSIMYDLKTNISAKEQTKKTLTAKKKKLEKTKQNLTNPDYVEYVARGKYLVTKEGEQVFKFPSSED